MTKLVDICVPDIGDFSDLPIIEILVKAGDSVAVDDSVISIESDKATMDIPSSHAGMVEKVLVSVGDTASAGQALLKLRVDSTILVSQVSYHSPSEAVNTSVPETSNVVPQAYIPDEKNNLTCAHEKRSDAEKTNLAARHLHASPPVRYFARQLGVDLNLVQSSRVDGRLRKKDVQTYVKDLMQVRSRADHSTGMTIGNVSLAPWPAIDFSKFGPTKRVPLSRIKRISGANLLRNAIMIPHVTNMEEADITELEAFRKQLNVEQRNSGVKLTLLAFLMKASVVALKKFPDFNSSLAYAENGQPELILKKYYHIGFAVDTPNGLVVPVIKNADQKSLLEIAQECGALAVKARDGKLTMDAMTGATFSISSLGGIGGTSFTPIVNAPEVAILGVAKAHMKPIWDGAQFRPRLMISLCLSWDHRVLDGVAAAKFTCLLAELLGDFRKVVV